MSKSSPRKGGKAGEAQGAWGEALHACADAQRASHFLKLLAATAGGPALDEFTQDPERARALATLLSGSAALGNLLVTHAQWLELLEPERLRYPRRKQGLESEVESWMGRLMAAADYGGGLRSLRELKQREMLRIAARDLLGLGDVPEIIEEISNVADVCLNSVWRMCYVQLAARHGQPSHQDANGCWQPTAGCMVGLGKLGGEELNYSSDVDVIFIYSEEGGVFRNVARAGGKRGTTQEKPVMTNHQFFNRLAEAVIADVGRLTPEGALFRIDLRLRPEGDSGPLSRSLAGYENYYAQWGQTWERMMLIKARGVAGQAALAAEFLEMIQPFRYPRSINESVLREVAAMKQRVENEVLRTGELDRNVKLGRGGIREIEFIAQVQQLLYAGRQPFLQGAQTLPCLAKLVQYDRLKGEDARALTEADCFLRQVEHRLQMDENLQTHTLPTDRKALERLGRLMGFGKWKEFEAARQTHTGHVRRIFDRVLKNEPGAPEAASQLPAEFEGAEAGWKEILAAHGFRDLDKAFRVLREFVEGPGYVHVSPRTRDLALQLVPRLMAMCPGPGARPAGGGKPAGGSGPGLEVAWLSDPDRVVTRLDAFINAYGARATLFELWNTNPAIFDLLLKLFDRSEFLAELAIRTPDLVDELVTSGRLRQRKSAEETLRDLRHGITDPDQHVWLRRYHQAELMRIGLRDILGLADFEQYLVELSALADACLQYALEVVMRRHKLKIAPFAVIGLGKLGGSEIDYGSDLDILFVADSKAKNLARLARVAIELMDLLSKRTEQGMLFHTDARLRPDGEKGLLVNTLKAYEDYYRNRAGLWEVQSLTRTRAVAGDRNVGESFQGLARELTDFRRPPASLAAWTPDWRESIHKMRMRIEKERTPRGKDELAIKTGQGGLMDAEFVAQALCLEHGWHEANTLRALERGRQSGALPAAEKLIEHYRKVRQVEGILRRWSYEGETVLPDDPAPFYRVAVRCGFESAEAFRAALREWRRGIREVYGKVFQT